MKIICCSYREWAKEIYNNLESKLNPWTLRTRDEDYKYEFIYINSKEEYSEEKIHNENPDLILWYGWSWMIPTSITEKYFSVMLHPSPLPKYRGGSPIQNQLINCEKESAVTLFKIDKGMDTGDIITQKPFQLLGGLDRIFSYITALGTDLSMNMIRNFNNLELVPQNNSEATYFERRKPLHSEISLSDLEKFTAEDLCNKIRALQDPYPNAFIKCKNGTKLYLTKSHV